MGIHSVALSNCIRTDLRLLASDSLHPSLSAKEYAATLLIRDVLRKNQDDINQEVTAAVALESFLEVNSTLGGYSPINSCEFEWEAEILGEIQKILYDLFYPKSEPLLVDYLTIAHKGSLGPGASIGANGTDFYTKLFSSDLTCTSRSLYDMYKGYVSHWEPWANAESARADVFSVKHVEGNKLCFVPKNEQTARTICVEPTLNMFFQLGIGNLITERLRQVFNIDLSVQPEVNRELALRGSAGQGFVTIDLSSASDTIGLRMVEELFPRHVVAWLKLFRCASTELPNGDRVQLNMLSTMGNGFTFPLQTALFSAAVTAVLRGVYEDPPKAGSLWSVFGDDIIVPKEAAPRVLRVLRLLGFRPNAAKTYVEGPFRESCGGDFFNGHNVRAVFVKSLATPQSRYVAYNTLLEWSLRNDIPLRSALGYLFGTCKKVLVPPWEQADSGFRVPASLVRNRRTRSGMLQYEAYRPRSVSIRLGDTEIVVGRGQRPRVLNPEGALVALLRGDIREGKLTPRQSVSLYRMKRLVCASWEQPGPSWTDGKLRVTPWPGKGHWSRWETCGPVLV